MEANLELVFLAADGRTVRITVNDPKDGLDEETVRNVMEEIIAADVFQSTGGASLAAVKEARKITRTVEVFAV